jgi:hypothetical protein
MPLLWQIVTSMHWMLGPENFFGRSLYPEVFEAAQ